MANRTRPRRHDMAGHGSHDMSDVIVFWVGSEADKQALVQDETTPFFTTPHFDGHNSVSYTHLTLPTKRIV